MNLTISESQRRRTEHDPDFGQPDGVTGDEYRSRAAEYVELARRDRERKRHLLGMAEAWLRLAVRADRIQALSHQARSAVPRNRNYGT